MKAAITLALCALAAAGEAGAQSRSPAGAVAAVVRLYRDYAWEAVVQEPVLEPLINEPRATLERYFEAPLVALILKDRACSAREKGICSLDFAPIWDAQDNTGASVAIAPGRDSTRVVATLRNAAGDEYARLTYAMVRTTAGWRIRDIAYSTHPSLATILRRAR